MTARKWLLFAGLIIVIVLLAGLVGVRIAAKTSSTNPQRLADGSTLLLKEMVLTNTNYNYAHNHKGLFLRLVEPILPNFLLQKLPASSGSFGFGSDGNTNIYIVTVTTRKANSSSSTVGRLRVIGDTTNVYDACWGASTLGMQNELVHGWKVRAFPRRSRRLSLDFLDVKADGSWSEAANFEIENPAYGKYPQWQPEPVPVTKTNEDLSVTLAEFTSGEKTPETHGFTTDSLASRSTGLLFKFEEDGQPSEDWRIQKVTISDATGNRWFPYLDLQAKRFSWASKGQVQFFGALWPAKTPGNWMWKRPGRLIFDHRTSIKSNYLCQSQDPSTS